MDSTVTLANVLADMGTILTSMMSWVGTVMTTIVANPILLIFVVGTFALVSIGIINRLLRL